MNIIIACEYSARVRDAFAAKGHNAWSCDLLPTDGDPENHYQGDISDFFEKQGMDWDLLIAHPPCTYLSVSGLHWNKRQPERALKTDDALKFITALWSLPIKKKCIENPVGCINSRLDFMPKPQYIQPYEFGEDASKKTGLWLNGLPPLIPTKRIPGRLVEKNGGGGTLKDGAIKLILDKTNSHHHLIDGNLDQLLIMELQKQWQINGVNL